VGISDGFEHCIYPQRISLRKREGTVVFKATEQLVDGTRSWYHWSQKDHFSVWPSHYQRGQRFQLDIFRGSVGLNVNPPKAPVG